MSIWTEKQTDNLNKYQNCACFHPYTCGGIKNGRDCRVILVATQDGWVCPDKCGYTQKWAHAMHTETDLTNNVNPIFGYLTRGLTQ